MTSEGHPGARLQRSLAACNLTAAEQAAFELPFIPLAEARALVELYAEKGDRKYERAALKYLTRYLSEANPSLADLAQVAVLLAGGICAMPSALGVALKQLLERLGVFGLFRARPASSPREGQAVSPSRGPQSRARS